MDKIKWQDPSSNVTAQRPNNSNLLHSKATDHSRAQLHAANEGGESGNVISPGLGIKITHGLLTSWPKHSGESFRLAFSLVLDILVYGFAYFEAHFNSINYYYSV